MIEEAKVKDKIAEAEAKVDKRPPVFFVGAGEGFPEVQPDPESEWNGSLFGDDYVPPEPEPVAADEEPVDGEEGEEPAEGDEEEKKDGEEEEKGEGDEEEKGADEEDGFEDNKDETESAKKRRRDTAGV